MRRRDWLKSIHLGAAAAAAPALAPLPANAGTSSPAGGTSRTAIQGVCAWPNLQRLSNGTLVVMIFNQPCHGLWEGDLDCWVSEDEGKTWRFRGRPAQHEPTTNRMNCSAGIASNGDLLVLCSGWADRSPKGQLSRPHRRVLRAWVCRSPDGGRTWSVSRGFPPPPRTAMGRDNQFIPFGNIRAADDGSLCAAVHLVRGDSRECHLLRSHDDGHTWGDRVPRTGSPSKRGFTRMPPASQPRRRTHLGRSRPPEPRRQRDRHPAPRWWPMAGGVAPIPTEA